MTILRHISKVTIFLCDTELTIMKLVRDLIPDAILKSGRKPQWHYASSQEEYLHYLMLKLTEEVNELLESLSMEEIADVLEVIEALCIVKNFDLKKILLIKKSKNISNGSFTKRIILESISI